MMHAIYLTDEEFAFLRDHAQGHIDDHAADLQERAVDHTPPDPAGYERIGIWYRIMSAIAAAQHPPKGSSHA